MGIKAKKVRSKILAGQRPGLALHPSSVEMSRDRSPNHPWLPIARSRLNRSRLDRTSLPSRQQAIDRGYVSPKNSGPARSR